MKEGNKMFGFIKKYSKVFKKWKHLFNKLIRLKLRYMYYKKNGDES